MDLPTARAPECSILNVTFDCLDSEAVATFWSRLTGGSCSRQDMPGNPFWVVELPGVAMPRLVFVEVTDPKQVKNRLHLDLIPSGDSQAGAVARIESWGGRIVDDRRDATPGGWVVMADPEGNEFCVEGDR